jgi:hypothetical protein
MHQRKSTGAPAAGSVDGGDWPADGRAGSVAGGDRRRTAGARCGAGSVAVGDGEVQQSAPGR